MPTIGYVKNLTPQILLDILTDEDPVGLIELGAPDDEYSSEARTIFKRLKENMTLEEIQTVVQEEFLYWFSIELVDDRAYNSIAQKILDNFQ